VRGAFLRVPATHDGALLYEYGRTAAATTAGTEKEVMSRQKLHFWLLLLEKARDLIGEWFLKQFFCLTEWKMNGNACMRKQPPKPLPSSPYCCCCSGLNP
jgi:hypothetical protein